MFETKRKREREREEKEEEEETRNGSYPSINKSGQISFLPFQSLLGFKHFFQLHNVYFPLLLLLLLLLLSRGIRRNGQPVSVFVQPQITSGTVSSPFHSQWQSISEAFDRIA